MDSHRRVESFLICPNINTRRTKLTCFLLLCIRLHFPSPLSQPLFVFRFLNTFPYLLPFYCLLFPPFMPPLRSRFFFHLPFICGFNALSRFVFLFLYPLLARCYLMHFSLTSPFPFLLSFTASLCPAIYPSVIPCTSRSHSEDLFACPFCFPFAPCNLDAI